MSWFWRSMAVLCLASLALIPGAPAQEPKKEPAKQPGGAFPDIEKMLPQGLPPEQLKQFRKMLERAREMQGLRNQFPGGFPGGMPGGFPGGRPGGFPGGFPGGMPGGFGPGFPFGQDNVHNRLGAGLKKPSAVLVEQLDLPRGEGLVLNEVRPDSAAAKAGLKTNDILLQLGGKAVSSEVGDFVKALNELKTGVKVDAVVLRKGKKETVKGVTLPDMPQNNPFQFQFQFQGGAAPGFPVQPPNFGPGAWNGGMPAPQDAQLNLVEGKARSLPTAYSGAFRIRALPPGPPVQNGFPQAQAQRARLAQEVAAEPRVQGFKVRGTPLLDSAVDDQGQKLTAADEPNGQAIPNNPFGGMNLGGRVFFSGGPHAGNVQQTVVRLKLGEKPAKRLKELRGSVPVEILMPAAPLLTVDNVLKAAGRTVKEKGGALEVKSVRKLPNGDYELKIALQRPGDGMVPLRGLGAVRRMRQMQIQRQGNNVVIGGLDGGAENDLPVLIDTKGKAFKLVSTQMSATNFNNNAVSEGFTLVYQRQEGQSDPARLVLHGPDWRTVQVPFTLRDVPLTN